MANLSLVYGKQDLPDIEEQYLKYSYYMICLYKRETMVVILKNAYQDKFHKMID